MFLLVVTLRLSLSAFFLRPDMTAEQQAVLSYLLYGYNEQRDIMPLLTIEHFQSAEARQIFSACRKLWQERKPIEINMLNKHDIEQT